eukprot:10681.XXX_618560_618745_1 [CDS] Oithona nana genome sequencing.
MYFLFCSSKIHSHSCLSPHVHSSSRTPPMCCSISRMSHNHLVFGIPFSLFGYLLVPWVLVT